MHGPCLAPLKCRFGFSQILRLALHSAIQVAAWQSVRSLAPLSTSATRPVFVRRDMPRASALASSQREMWCVSSGYSCSFCRQLCRANVYMLWGRPREDRRCARDCRVKQSCWSSSASSIEANVCTRRQGSWWYRVASQKLTRQRRPCSSSSFAPTTQCSLPNRAGDRFLFFGLLRALAKVNGDCDGPGAMFICHFTGVPLWSLRSLPECAIFCPIMDLIGTSSSLQPNALTSLSLIEPEIF